MIEIDLIPNVGPDANSIVSIAQADPDVWTGIAAQANQLASNTGYDIQTGPLYNSPERTLASVADVQGWLAAQNVGGAAACPLDLPAPQGYAVWQGAVPPVLSAWAVQLLKGVSKVPFGTTWTENYNGATVLARCDVHTWHYLPDGTLLTGLCWKGITLYKPLPAGVGATDTDVTNIGTATPDPTLAVYDQSPPSGTNWPLVIVSGVAITATVAAFLLAIKLAGRPRLR